MRIVIKRVSRASVTIDSEVKSSIGKGYLILVGIEGADTHEDADWLVHKVIGLRVFEDEQGVMNRDILSVQGEILVVSQFTLFASYKKGNRPAWFRAATHDVSVPLYNYFCTRMSEALGKQVGTGEFGADMKVELLHLSAAAVACVGFAIIWGILLQTLIQILRTGIATGVWHKGMLAYYAVISFIFAFFTVMLAMRAMIDGVTA